MCADILPNPQEVDAISEVRKMTGDADAIHITAPATRHQGLQMLAAGNPSNLAYWQSTTVD